jgi:hypothetical protein
MDKLPVELARKIFSQACYNDKATGCSLILTSKWIGEVVEVVRFETLSLCGVYQVKGFASTLQRSRRVKHLFMSGIGVKEAEERRVSSDKLLRKLAVRHELIDGESDPDPTEYIDADIEVRWFGGYGARHSDQALEDSVRAIIQSAARSLQTLFMVELWLSNPRVPFDTSFPELTDVSMITDYLGLKSNQTYPKLKRIHTTSKIRGDCSSEIVDFRQTAPVLEQLRLTGVCSYDERWLPRALSKETPDILLFPNTMRRVIVQQCSPPYIARCGNAYISHRHLGRSLEQAASLMLANSLNGQGVGYDLVVLEAQSLTLWLKGGASGLSYCFEDARREWVDLVHDTGTDGWDDVGATAINPNLARYVW